MSWVFTSGDQSIGASASASVLPMNIQGWFPLGSTGLISLLTKGLSRVFSSTIWKHQFFKAESINTEKARPSLWSNSHICTWLGKTTALTMWTFVNKVMFLLFKMLSRFVIAFLPRRKHLLTSGRCRQHEAEGECKNGFRWPPSPWVVLQLAPRCVLNLKPAL